MAREPLPHVTVDLPEEAWITILSWFGPMEGEGYDDAEDREVGEALEAALIAQGVSKPDIVGWRWHP